MWAVCAHNTTLNVESLSQMATRHKTLVVLLQETHCTNADQLVITHFTLAGWVLSRKLSFATFVHEKLSWTLVNQCSESSTIEWLCVDTDGCKIVNVYKPPTLQLTVIAISMFLDPCLCAGNFNCQNTDWDYNYTSPDGESPDDWAAK